MIKAIEKYSTNYNDGRCGWVYTVIYESGREVDYRSKPGQHLPKTAVEFLMKCTKCETVRREYSDHSWKKETHTMA